MNQEVTGGRELKQIARFFEHSIPKYIFLVIDDERLARMLIDRIRSELKARAREIGYLKLAGQDTAVFRRVERFLAGNRCDGLIVSGLNGPVYRDPVTTLSQLNKARDAFERFSLPMAFIVNRDTLKKIIQSASDFYQLRDLPDFHFAGTVEEERMMIDIPASMIDTIPDAGLKAGLLEGQLRLREKEGEIDDGLLNSLVIPLLTIYTGQGDMRKAGEIYDKYIRGWEDRVKDIAGLGAFHLNAFHLEDALHYYRAGLDLAEKTGDIKGVAKSLHQVGIIYHMEGDYEAALEQYRKSLAIREKIGDIAGVAKSRHQVGIIYHMKGDYDAALEQYRKSLEIKEKIGDIKGVALSLWGIGNVYLDKGDYDNALEQYQKALETFEKIGDIKNVAGCLHQVGMIYEERGEYDAALEQYRKSLEIREKVGDIAGVAKSLYQVGMIYEERGEYDAALEQYRKSLEIKEKIGDIKGVAKSLHQVGMIYQEKGDYDAALEQYRKSLEIKEKIGNVPGKAISLAQMGAIYFVKEDYPVALNLCIQSHEIFKKIGSPNAKIVMGNIARIRDKIGEEAFQELMEKMTTDSTTD